MERFGYEDEGELERTLEDETVAVERLLKRFQKHNGLTVSGEKDEETMKLLNTKRCGNKDDISETELDPIANLRSSDRSKRYETFGRYLF